MRGVTLKDRLAPGLYRVHWISGGSSLAAVGCNADGTNWLAPINWVSPSRTSWYAVAFVERLDIPTAPVAAPEPTSEADAWYAAEVERMAERAPA
jgi:hypothetical protein